MATTEYTSGFVDCMCRDCFDVAVADDIAKGAFCSDCIEAGCPKYQGVWGMTQECQRVPGDDYDTDVG
jgi:hypothetical protein